MDKLSPSKKFGKIDGNSDSLIRRGEKKEAGDVGGQNILASFPVSSKRGKKSGAKAHACSTEEMRLLHTCTFVFVTRQLFEIPARRADNLAFGCVDTAQKTYAAWHSKSRLLLHFKNGKGFLATLVILDYSFNWLWSAETTCTPYAAAGIFCFQSLPCLLRKRQQVLLKPVKRGKCKVFRGDRSDATRDCSYFEAEIHRNFKRPHSCHNPHNQAITYKQGKKTYQPLPFAHLTKHHHLLSTHKHQISFLLRLFIFDSYSFSNPTFHLCKFRPFRK
ncbi:hypothetical protein BT69DRAFT_43317 [Atractiella rhizophila]|nr:hypothetical protein BT69DRAFT_43317 [Atractiella rhizophila]